MDEHLKDDLVELMRALQELAYGVMLTTGQVTATKVISAAAKVEATILNLPSNDSY